METMHNFIYRRLNVNSQMFKLYYNVMRNFSSKASDSIPNCDKSNQETNRPIFKPEEVSIDEPPTTCCMSGCHNCVYIAWADALSKQMARADPAIARKVLENVKDPSMKAFLRMELNSLGLL